MTNESTRIPIHGSMTRPGSPAEGVAEMKAGAIPWYPADNLTVEIKTVEFTALCPTTGQPDFYELSVSYCPHAFYIESKTLKFYLWSFRNEGVHCEKLAKRIAHDFKDAINCGSMIVKLVQLPRGGIGLTATFEL